MSNQRTNDVDQLNSFLRGELSAVETYGQALGKIDEQRSLSVLRENRASHERRADALRQYIRSIGGQPSQESGAWGTFAKAVEGGAAALGTGAAIAALEEGEDHGLADYRRDLSELSAESRVFVTTELLPLQQRTHEALSTLKSKR